MRPAAVSSFARAVGRGASTSFSVYSVDLSNPTVRLRPDTAQLAPANSLEDAGLMPICASGTQLTAGSVYRDGMHVDLQWHFHDMHKLLYAFEGAIEVESSHGRHLVPRQLAAWIPAGVPHCTSIHGIRWVSVFFPIKMLNDPERRVRTLMVSALMREMMREAMRWPVDSPEICIRRIFFEAMATLCGEWITREANLLLPTSKDPRMRRALDYTNLRMDSNLADVCRHAGMSVRSLRRHLKAETGMTWEEYRHRSQLLQAISLLSETDQPISETAAQCGFESPSGFAKAFRLAMGEAPRDYRVRVRGSSPE
jgi:AraC-like DNA-binding protein